MNRNPSMAGLASLVQSRGRNGDSVLVHMAPEEVHGLQSLALAHGGSLTINPDTGLVEANFLKKLLPTIIGAILTPLSGGLINPFTAGLLVGGVEGLRTGDLGKGLMAGLGAFGGAGLSSALAGAGSAVASGAGEAIKTAGTEAASAALKEGANQAAQEAAKQTAMKELAAKKIAEQTATKSLFGRLPEGVASLKNISTGAQEIFKTGGAGLGGIGGMNTAGAAFNALPGGMIGKAGLVTSAANALTPEMEVPEGAYNIDDSYYESMGYSPEQGRFLGGQWRKGYPGFPGYAMGGAVMPRTNYDYPQAGITKSNYAPSLEYTKPQEILDGYDTKIDPFTGAERFAEGGQAQSNLNQATLEEGGRLAEKQQKEFTDTLSILTMNPGMSFAKAAEFTGYKGAAQPEHAGYQARRDTSANFNWGADLPYDPNIYANQFKWQEYIAANPDLAAAGIDTPWEAATHYSNYGKNENRPGVGFLNSGVQVLPGGQVVYPQPVDEPSPEDIEARLAAYREREANQPQVAAPAAPTPTPAAPTTTPAPTGIASTLPRTPFVQNVSTTTTAPTSYMPYAPAASSYYQTPSSYFTAPQPPTPDQFPSLEDYYKTLMTAPQQQTPSSSFADYMQSLNKFVTSPVAPLTVPQTAVAPPPNTTVTGGGTGTTGTGSGTGLPGGLGGMQWNPAQGRFVNTPGSMGDTYNNLAELQNLVNSGMFSGFNFGDLGNYLGTGGSDTSGMVWNPSTGSFMQPGTQLDVNAAPYNMQTQIAANTYTQPTFGIPTTTPTIPYNNPYQNSMSTGDYATAVTSPYITEPEIDYGSDMFGLGQDANIFGFSGGGSTEYAAAGKLLRGPGDGMSDDIRANIDGKQEARLADGEFVVPADVVSHLGNGSSEAGSRKLYAMMDKIRKDRTGRKEQAPEVKAEKYLPA